MIGAELRDASKPNLNEALGWIGSRVDDIYGVGVGRLEDVWIDPGTGTPRWLLVTEGGFGGRTTLIPFEDATAGADHVWIPYERDVVREAPEVEPGAPLTQQVESALRAHYSANTAAAVAHGHRNDPAATSASAQQHPHADHNGQMQERLTQERHTQPPPLRPPAPPQRPAAPIQHQAPVQPAPAPVAEPQFGQRTSAPEIAQEPSQGRPMAAVPPPPAPAAPAPPAPTQERPSALEPDGTLSLPRVESLDQAYWVEIELEGGARISGPVRGLRITPLESGADGPRPR